MLVAIAIPVFTSQLEKSREATDQANVRSAYAEVMAQYLTNADNDYSMTVTAKQTQDGWQQGTSGYVMTQIDGKEGSIAYDAKTNGAQYTIKITSSGSVTIN